MLAGQEGYEQGKLIVNERGGILVGKVDGIEYDQGSDMATVRFGRAVAARKGGPFEAVKKEKISFKATESLPLQIENRAVKFSIFPFGDRGVLVPRGIFLVQGVWEAAGLGFLMIPYGIID